MIHDLTANQDFQKQRNWNIILRSPKEDEITSPFEEVVLTGTSSDRDHKRYILDYESEQKNMCDCCGAPIRIRPWDFEESKTLCPDCDKWLETEHNRKQSGELLKEIIDDSFTVRAVKPWDIDSLERENAVDNVLLWD
ncbi:MAG: hypothetical protein NC124_20310 [Clostridium sp.]|nr:hypothetical protein [Ruminococcus flavefaciens]MCM1500808.1 hypothetical protein [Clostridium sp.]